MIEDFLMLVTCHIAILVLTILFVVVSVINMEESCSWTNLKKFSNFFYIYLSSVAAQSCCSIIWLYLLPTIMLQLYSFHAKQSILWVFRLIGDASFCLTLRWDACFFLVMSVLKLKFVVFLYLTTLTKGFSSVYSDSSNKMTGLSFFFFFLSNLHQNGPKQIL